MEISHINPFFTFKCNNKSFAENDQQILCPVTKAQNFEAFTDTEAKKVYAETMNQIRHNNIIALSAHSGLSASRVFDLVGAL